MVDWANTLIAVAGFILAIIALTQTSRSNREAREANNISREANEHAGRALQLQEDESNIRLLIEPRMMCVIGDGEDERPRPVVKVVNLSAFPVTIDAIHWKNNRETNGHFYWKNPTIANPFGKLPVRLPPRESLTALGSPTSFQNLDDLASVTAAVAYTACGEDIEGMTDQWKETVARMVAENEAEK
tara:strand:+ start:174874 stop:175434 length:561 start_codon:yes stop_codon:yes gene_type:complete